MISFPNESEAYRQARNELLQAEIALRAKVEEVAALRRRLPLGGTLKEDYVFADLDGRAVRLSELFSGDKRTLLLYSYMYGPEMASPCPSCTSLLDGLDGSAPHIGQNADLAVVISGSVDQAGDVYRTRGWKNLRLLSAAGCRYNRDYHGEHPDNGQMPMMNVFTRQGQQIHHFWGSELLFAPSDGDPRHVDQLWPLWNALDLTPAGRGEKYPQLSY